MQDQAVRHLQIENLAVEIYPTRLAAGAAAAQAAAKILFDLTQDGKSIAVIFATGASQLDMLQNLVAIPGLPWDKVNGFHMDEYIDIAPDHPASFRRYLRQNLTQHIELKSFLEINGNASDPKQLCAAYAQTLRAAGPQLCLLGVGENGHLAFNDPGEADFSDPVDMKVVRLDRTCREQQVAEGWFKSYPDVPERAITLTIPALFRVPRLIASVPGVRKAKIMHRTLFGPISTECPSTLLRRHRNATVYLDEESAAELQTSRAASRD